MRPQTSTSKSSTVIVWKWTSQMRASSNDAVTMRDPSGLKVAELTTASWPRRTLISSSVAAPQMRAVRDTDEYQSLTRCRADAEKLLSLVAHVAPIINDQVRISEDLNFIAPSRN